MKGNCIVCDDEIDVEYCCSGHECGCMGMPIDPPFCSTECEEEFIDNQINKDAKVKGRKKEEETAKNQTNKDCAN